MTIVCGHRGLGTTRPGAPFPENTLESIVAAEAAGAAMVEFDVQITRDDVPVLMHDDTLDRTTTGTGCVSAWSLAEVQAWDAGVGSALLGQGVRAPSLAEVLAAVSLPLNVEIKVADGTCRRHDAARVAEVVLATLRADPLAGSRALIVSSFDLELLRAVRAQDSGLRLGWLIEQDGDPVAWIAQAREAGCQALHPHHISIKASLADQCAAAGLELNTWTVNDVARAAQLAAWGVHTLITDDPAGVSHALAQS